MPSDSVNFATEHIESEPFGLQRRADAGQALDGDGPIELVDQPARGIEKSAGQLAGEPAGFPILQANPHLRLGAGEDVGLLPAGHIHGHQRRRRALLQGLGRIGRVGLGGPGRQQAGFRIDVLDIRLDLDVGDLDRDGVLSGWASQLCVVMPLMRSGRTQSAGTLNVAVSQLPDGLVRMSQDRYPPLTWSRPQPSKKPNFRA